MFEINEDNMILLGLAVYQAQKIEFALYGIVLHLPQAKQKKRFSKISPSDFLSDEPEQRKKRKATLGQIVETFGEHLMLPEQDIESLVQRRNFIIHEFFRATVPGKVIEGVENPSQYLLNFCNDCQEWIKAFEGLLSYMTEAAAEKEGRLDEFTLTEEKLSRRETYNKLVQKFEDTKN